MSIVFFILANGEMCLALSQINYELARSINHMELIGHCRLTLAQVLRKVGNHQAAVATLKKARQAFHLANIRQNEGVAVGNLGNLYYELRQTRQALACYKDALIIAQSIGDEENAALWSGNLGVAHSALGEHQKAIHYYEQALAAARIKRDLYQEGRRLCDLGDEYLQLGQYARALALYREGYCHCAGCRCAQPGRTGQGRDG
ncbi:MAG: tetratricopeptide repeat protein [Chloroflexi bacterium]|nr:tetratricopeptide repeat protein [Chloroflexota bacterium]